MSYTQAGCTHSGVVDVGDDCCPHQVSGVILTSQTKVSSDGKAIAVDGTTVVINGNPHTTTGTIKASNTKVLVNGKPTAMIGDTVDYNGMGTGVITSGIPKIGRG